MSLTLARTHIESQRRLRATTTQAVGRAWTGLAGYDEGDVPRFLSLVLPLVLAAQRQSVALTNAYFARELGRQPLPLSLPELTGAALRGGTDPAEVYRRPFVNVWTALKTGTPYEQAVRSGLERATGTAEMDVQLAMRTTTTAIADRDPVIVGYRRIPDPGACDFCLIAAQNRYSTGDLMELHNRCGCGVAPITLTRDPIQEGDLMDRLAAMRARGAQDDHTDRRAAAREEKRASDLRDEVATLRAQADGQTDTKKAGAARRRATNLEKKATAAQTKADAARESLRIRKANRDAGPAIVPHGELGPVLVQSGHSFTQL